MIFHLKNRSILGREVNGRKRQENQKQNMMRRSENWKKQLKHTKCKLEGSIDNGIGRRKTIKQKRRI